MWAPRGAVRRLLKGVVPLVALRALLRQIPPRTIPWDFVDLIETDPARRVKLKISHERLAKLHPADIADIVEDLAPDEREAVFETLDEDVAAEALEEVEPKVQKAIVESLDSERAAEIVEEMEPDAAADLLADLPEERTSEILLEMQPAGTQGDGRAPRVQGEHCRGRMNTEYLAVNVSATVHDARRGSAEFRRRRGNRQYHLPGGFAGHAGGGGPPGQAGAGHARYSACSSLTQEPLISRSADAKEKEVAELFDKYNLLTLPVVDDNKKLTGVITSDDVISLLRANLYLHQTAIRVVRFSSSRRLSGGILPPLRGRDAQPKVPALLQACRIPPSNPISSIQNSAAAFMLVGRV